MKRKIFLITLMVALFVCLFAISVSAADIPEWTDVITYETGENAIAYKDGFDTTSRVLLDNGDGTYSTYPTNYIIKGTDAVFSTNELDFSALKAASGNSTYGNSSIIRLEVPTGFTSVEARAFRTGAGLKVTSMLTLKLPEGITTIGSYMCYQNTVIVEVELPDSITTIEGTESFLSATSLKKINIPAALTAIPDTAFAGCTSLSDVDFSKCESLTSIGLRAFKQCKFTSVTIPEGVTTLGDYAFFGCSLLEYIYIPSSVTSMGLGVCETSSSIQTIVCKASVIGERAFTGCNKVTSITLENTVSIGKSAFNQCGPKGAGTGTTLVFPETLTTIGAGAFDYFYFETITLPKTLQSVDSTAFTTGAYMKKILFTGTEEQASTLIGTAKKYELVNHCEVYYKGAHNFDAPTYEFVSFVASAYLNGDCSRCKLEGSKTEVAPIFYDFGYSARIDDGSGSRGLVFTYFINNDSLAIYNEYNEDKTVSFGIVAAFEGKITNADSEVYNPLNADGTAVQGNVVAYNITNEEIISIDFIIKGEQATWEKNDIPSSPLYMLGYVIDDTGLYYIGNNAEKEASQSTTITDLRTITYNELFVA